MYVCMYVCMCVGVCVQASVEPPFLQRHRVCLSKWKPVLEGLEDVMLQVSAMETVLGGQGQCICNRHRLLAIMLLCVVDALEILGK